MATHHVLTSIFLILFVVFFSSVQAQTAVSTTLTFVAASSVPGLLATSTSIDSPATPSGTSTTTEVYTPYAICATGGGDWYIDPPTATRLTDLFCDSAYQPGSLPQQGEEFDLNEYPTDLIPLTANDTTPDTDTDTAGTLTLANLTTAFVEVTPNYTLTELSGIILALRLVRRQPTVVENITYISGSPAQCDADIQQDQCHAGFRHVIDQCQWNSHYFGGVNFWMTACAMYSVQVANCSGNWLDPNCDLWHRKWPGVGDGPDPSSSLTTTGTNVETALTNTPTTRTWRA
ncbi:uncharacterized protein Z520_11095 [Fonsecaea multimorphosa CBS 102226]|uniref:Uncharacterized protein n=1 Tax=Fonsecaea multimorphosa CBS 102226 TaxID=1442371 RepID=A0A0D2GUL7_9EURO|nr:uncharacterized protein Z520_11095 [Fonsecaea multimorphosa CBS 102226]KIX93240.1 hypothetical protein Z520_11095 [Fonsecaea multimorphosa CBS 102226]OAL18472.1 hypothetical protein AYO22_10668 [Fonsecaea multimorphosa]